MKPTDPNHTPQRWIRDKHGFIYAWDEILAKNPSCVEIADSILFPEKYAANPEPTTPKQRGRPKKDLGAAELEAKGEENANPPAFSSTDFSVDASKGLPK